MFGTRLGATVLMAAATFAPLAAHASHADLSYDQPILFAWGDRGLPIDVFVVPPEHGQVVNGHGFFGGTPGGALVELDPCRNSYTQAIRAAVAAWEAAIGAFGPPWLGEGVAFRPTVAGCDGPRDPAGAEIVVATDQSKAIVLGFSLDSKPCLANVSKFLVTSFSYEDMFNVALHEIGHCLGLGHVGDGHPARDTMDASYDGDVGSRDGDLFCPSNLNVAGLASSFGSAFGRPGGATATMPVWLYQRMQC